MKNTSYYKSKIINDPIYGFIKIYDKDDIVFNLIEHPYFQRLRRIKQLGLTSLVFPGALHTRFHHTLGAMHLMNEALDVLRLKGVNITEEEKIASIIAILLHDIGHGPYSHSLEHTIVHGINHEQLSELFMERLNKQFKGKLSLAIKIFKNEYSKTFLHQLVSSQLDVDRLDYLNRDSFYTGVSEGVVSSERIIKMLNVVNDKLVAEEKGIYSIEKFIIARRLMYWQVYLHKTVLSAENLMINILKRAKFLSITKQEDLFATPHLKYFLCNKVSIKNFTENKDTLDRFAELDDYDIMASIKVWKHSKDKVLSTLCSNMVNRKLYKVEIQKEPFTKEAIDEKKLYFKKKMNLTEEEINYFVFSENVANNIYNVDKIKINILSKNQKVKDITDASDQLNIDVLSKTIKKYFLCYPNSDN